MWEVWDIIVGWFFKFLAFLFTFFPKKENLTVPYPKKTLILFPKRPQKNYWCLTPYQGKSNTTVMDIKCYLSATNITRDLDIKPIMALLKKSNIQGSVLPWFQSDRAIHPIGIINARTICNIEVRFRVDKPFCKEGESFKSDVIIVDQFNNRQKVKNILFRYRS